MMSSGGRQESNQPVEREASPHGGRGREANPRETSMRWWCVLGLMVSLACSDAQPPARVGSPTVEPSPVAAVPRVALEPLAPDSAGLTKPIRAESLELTFVGDVVLGRYLEHRGAEVFVEMHPAHADPFAAVTGLLAADVVVGNLESPIVRELPSHAPIAHRNQFGGSAAHLGQLERAGFHVLSLANNHFFDLGVPGQLDGPDALADAGLFAIGASRSEPPLLRIETLEVDGWRVGFLAFATIRNHRGLLEGPYLPFTSLAELDDLDAELALARADHDLLIAVVHWGTEYAERVGLSNRIAARGLLAAGVDLVIGHHPHVLQALERHESGPERDGLIAYSLGNFLFPRNDGGAELSGVLRVRYLAGPEQQRPCLEQARLHPVHMVRKPRWHPEPAHGLVAARVRKRMVGLSNVHGTTLRKIDDGEDLLVEGLRACP
jgi:poly-gamma-glutamate synthesis protein (capsule biosynthesis protein)